jgi:hypothetical protein
MMMNGQINVEVYLLKSKESHDEKADQPPDRPAQQISKINK